VSQSRGQQSGWGLKHVIHEERLSTGSIQPGEEEMLEDLNGICNCLMRVSVEKMDSPVLNVGLNQRPLEVPSHLQDSDSVFSMG